MVWKLFVIGGDGNKGLIANRIVLKDLVIIEFVIVYHHSIPRKRQGSNISIPPFNC